MISGVGYNYRWAPLVRYAADLIARGELGEITNYRGRFFSMYGSDPLGLLSWRFKLDEGGHGVTSDLLSHAVDLAQMLLGPITRVVGHTATFIPERPVALPGAGHYGRGAPGDPTGEVTNEDYAGMLCEFANGVRGSFEASRTIVGPESQMAFDVHGTRGALGWNLEKLNELQLYRLTDDLGSGYTTVYGGDRFPYHGHFVPGSANGIGFEDLVVIEDFEFMRSVAEERPTPRVRRRARVGERAGGAAALGRVGPLGGRRVAEGRRDPRRRHRRGPDRPHARRAPRARGRRAQPWRPSRTPHAPSRRRRGGELDVPVAGSVDELLAGDDVDAVAICTQHRHARRADRGGGRAPARRSSARSRSRSTSPTVDRALAAVEAAGVPFQIGFNRRFDPAHQSVRDAVAQRRGRRVAPGADHQPRPGAAADRVRRASRAGSSST